MFTILRNILLVHRQFNGSQSSVVGRNVDHILNQELSEEWTISDNNNYGEENKAPDGRGRHSFYSRRR